MADSDLPNWHDSVIHSIGFREPDPDRDDWTCELSLDIDAIVEWVANTSPIRFRVAPATLTFHDVGDVSIRIDAPQPGGLGGHRPWIERVERTPDPQAQPPCDRWRIVLGSGEITFHATSYTQELRAEPQLVEQQSLSYSQRAALEPG